MQYPRKLTKSLRRPYVKNFVRFTKIKIFWGFRALPVSHVKNVWW